MEVLRNRNLGVKFQIMVEVALQQPNIRQGDVARKLNLTNQAISEYFQELKEEGWIEQQGRSKYRLTREGVAWMLSAYREMIAYMGTVGKAITSVSVSAAIAGGSIREGQEVGLVMDKGVLYATAKVEGPAKAVAVTSARRGEDVGVTEIEGIIPLRKGRVHIFKVPRVEKGGSRTTDLRLLQTSLHKGALLGCIGLEALSALKKIGRRPDYFYGVAEAAVEAANSGLDFQVVVTEDYLVSLLSRLDEEDIEYQLVDLSRSCGG